MKERFWKLIDALPTREIALLSLAVALSLTYRAYAGEGRKQRDVQIQQEENTRNILRIIDKMDGRVTYIEQKHMEAAGTVPQPQPIPQPTP